MVVEGSSPLSRGIRPANPRTTRCRRDHPRSHGEYLEGLRGGSSRPGSSPLSRGIQVADPVDEGPVRIIPALAGNTFHGVQGDCAHGDHPRSRGEYYRGLGERDRPSGSSPLSRGIRVMFPSDHPDSRIIPALAGNTARLVLPRSGPPDHPRSRGEYGINGAVQQGDSGSSPLSRGIPRAGLLTSPGQGIIPALAGNTQALPSQRPPSWDHPRSRGEYNVAC